MAEWQQKRFWADVSVEPTPQGFAVALDGRRIKTPEKAELLVPTRALASAIAEEWRRVEAEIRPETMPLTRAANAALDKVVPQFTAVADLVAAYGATDLLCYRADAPAGLVAAQKTAWDPWLHWCAATLGAPLLQTTGVLPIAQPGASLAALRARVARQSAFELTAFHDLVTLSGSLILGLAVAEGALAPAEAWDLSRIDEDWQAAQWGLDAEAEAAANARRAAFLSADTLLGLTREIA